MHAPDRLPPGFRRRGRVFYVQYKVDGQWRLKAVGSDLRQALLAHARLRGDHESAPTAPILGIIFDAWLDSQSTRNRPRTVQVAQQRSRTLLRLLGSDTPASLIDVEEFIRVRRAEGVRDVSINGDLTILRAALRHAHEVGLLDEPPRVKLLRTLRKRRRPTLDRKDVAKLLATARDMDRPNVELFILIAGATALRMAEVLHLRWSDVDFVEQRIDVRAKSWVERRYDRQARKVVTRECSWAPKAHAERSVWVNSRAFWDVLKARKGDGWVLQGRRGLRLTTISKALREVFQWADLYVIGQLAQTFRRSVGTSLLANGVDLETVRDFLGHENVATTALYLHASDKRTRAAAKRLKLVG